MLKYPVTKIRSNSGIIRIVRTSKNIDIRYFHNDKYMSFRFLNTSRYNLPCGQITRCDDCFFGSIPPAGRAGIENFYIPV